ncbi:hypothetical protein COCCADRAFT_113628 [Bipolaris zeicola 26-R-13]|uniref:Uncharacterized protein n=1 Tax=Cochliobolus carbonum (strain 26-R-13) TaxID=930089 RepID=W6XMD7_COCC2|nr:uncharacterized protein COCCADRAFT_113628 [Bipolaris zeicola 26-R-13]EUC26693.1 hypothetical protein COCCADRAFT_113628 [Bipolaris zeicola 26-R-13]
MLVSWYVTRICSKLYVTKPENRSLDDDGRFCGISKDGWSSCIVHNLFYLRIGDFLAKISAVGIFHRIGL